MDFRCPGQDKRNLVAEMLTCPACGYRAEVFSDEMGVACPRCKKRIGREAVPSCIDWCKLARECVGSAGYDRYQAGKALVLKKKLTGEVEKYWAYDRRKVDRALEAMDRAEALLRAQGGDWHIVVPACLLNDMGADLLGKKHGRQPGADPEPDDLTGIRKILYALGFKPDDAAAICRMILDLYAAKEPDTQNFKVFREAVRQAGL